MAHEGGRCQTHSQEAQAELGDLKQAFLAKFRDGLTSVVQAGVDLGVSRTTIWRWRQEDPDFASAYADAQAEHDANRMVAIEDALFQKIVSGRASPALEIFWAVNRAPERWRDLKRVHHSGQVLHGMLAVVASLTDAQIEEIMQLPEDEQQDRLLKLVPGGVEVGVAR